MINPNTSHILAINAGSSSIKFALYEVMPVLAAVVEGEISGIGSSRGCFTVRGRDSTATLERTFVIPEHVTAAHVLVEWLTGQLAPASLCAIAHRVVHGGVHPASSQEIDSAMLRELYDSATADPEHLPQELHLIELLRRQFPDTVHIACFDSAFHAVMPVVASMMAIPHRYHDAGIRRFGYHGLSCAYLMRQLGGVIGPDAAARKVILAHLGGGASVTAVEGGHSRDTTMGFSPAGGIAMACRSGDIDPGLAWYCARKEKMTPAQFNHMVNHEAGLLGVSGTTGDLRELMAHQKADARAAQAVALFCYQTRKAICAMAAAIKGVDTLVFTAGVGANSAEARARICDGLAHIGVLIDDERNHDNAALISADASAVKVRVIRTDEQWMIAEEARMLLSRSSITDVPEAPHG
ncbi:MAG: acetate kinase [Massilia sp.]|nr:acetate kinase [Massilia sp.]